MHKSARPFIVTLVLGVVAAAALAAGQGASTAIKVLVLRNGRVLHGEVTRLGDRAVVVLPNGGQVQLPTRDIAVEAESMEDAYESLRASLRAPDQVDGHLELANWCMREGLHAQATSELLTALQIKPNDPRIDRLSRQLEYSSEPKSTAAKKAEQPKNAKRATAQELDSLTRSMPKMAVEEFTSSVQLLLLNRCGTAHCHDSNSQTSLRLMRPAKGERFWRSMTLRNLHATKLQIDASHPEQSPLLKMAATPHGGSATAVLEQKDGSQYETLMNWVAMATNTTPERELNPYELQPRPFSQDARPNPLPSPSANVDEAASIDDLGSANAEDPFDPALFNEAAPQQN